ncbi:restriction endonuclease subunit S [Candidatus Poribacteria bacterium]
MKPYSRYKPSSVEWIREIPEHWEEKKLKYFTEIVLGKMLTNEDKGGYLYKPYLRAQNVNWERVNSDDIKKMWFSEKELEQYRLKANDLLVSEGGEIGRTAIWRDEIEECYIQNSVHKVTMLHGNAPLYFLYLFLLYGQVGGFESMANKVSIAHLTREKLKEVLCITPSPEERISIGRYIQTKANKIDGLIGKKQRLIELLKEQRTAIISQAVTKGLNPDVKMRDSCIEWLGKIPEHWKIKKLNHVINGGLRNGIFKRREKFGGGTKLVNVINLYKEDFCVNADELERVEITDKELCDYKVNAGDIFFVRSSLKREGIGVSACIKALEEPLVYECHLIKVTPDPKQEDFRYMINYLNSSIVRDRIISLSYTTTMTTIPQPALSSLQVALPPVEEQAEIAEHIESETTRIHNIIYRLNREIELLQEYRITLVSEVVTGKIDVRAEVTP